MRFEEGAQPREFTWGAKLEFQRLALARDAGGDLAGLENPLETVGELHGATMHAHARQVDLDAPRWHGG